MRILLVCGLWTTYISQLWSYVKKYYPDVKYSLLISEEARAQCEANIKPAYGERFYYFSMKKGKISKIKSLYSVIKNLPQFDIIHSLWMEPYWGIAIWMGLGRKCKCWFSSVGGSDLYRPSTYKRSFLLQKTILNRAQWFSSENVETRAYFYKVYGDKYKDRPHPIIRFGVDIIDEIKIHENDDRILLRQEIGVPNGKRIIMCGHNAGAPHNHLGIIEAISTLEVEIMQKCFFVFPMTYGGTDDYISEVEERISKVTENYLILREYMSTEEMAKVALATDIMIHVQDTDQLSSTMMAHIYCGNVVIAGDWLPYQSLKDSGIKMVSVKAISNLTETIKGVVMDFDDFRNDYKTNQEIAYKLSSWGYAVKEWYGAYKGMMQLGQGEENKSDNTF